MPWAHVAGTRLGPLVTPTKLMSCGGMCVALLDDAHVWNATAMLYCYQDGV
jgi:hypothetical protein